jgi:hypothetical protein
MHADRTNRAALTLFGLLVLLAGAAALTASTGGFGTAYAHRALLANPVGAYVGRHGGWLWPAIAAACLLIAFFALRWIVALLLSTDRARDITITGGSRQGRTTMHPAALTGAVTREIETYHGADTAKARVLGDPDDPALVVTVGASRSADLAALRHRIESEALSHARQAVGQPGLPIQLEIDVSNRDLERVSPKQPVRESVASSLGE